MFALDRNVDYCNYYFNSAIIEITKATLRGRVYHENLIGGFKMEKKVYGLTDEQVEREIERLNASEAVALARREARLRYKRRQYLYQLRDLEKKGKALLKAGITREMLDAVYKAEKMGADYED